jgi:hypothetical protein
VLEVHAARVGFMISARNYLFIVDVVRLGILKAHTARPGVVLEGGAVRIRRCIQKFPDWVHKEITTTIINTRSEATQRVMAGKLTRLTHKIAIQLHLVAESCTICSSRSRRPVRKLLDTPSYIDLRFVTKRALLWGSGGGE